VRTLQFIRFFKHLAIVFRSKGLIVHLSTDIFTATADAISPHGDHLFWSGAPNEALMRSIDEFGQAAPVLVRETASGLQLVTGAARLAALAELGRPVLARMVVDADDRDAGLLYMADNSRKELDDGMRLAALRYFRTLMDDDALRSDILPRLGIKPKSKDAKLLFAWLALPESWQRHLTTGNVPLAAADAIKAMSDADRDAVEPLFAGMSWSRSNAVNLLTWLFETSKMTGDTVDAVMKKAGMDGIMAQGLSPKDAIARLGAAARSARYPALTTLQTEFTRAASGITTGTRWRMVQPNNFETGGAEITVQIKNADQLRRAVEELQAMADAPGWATLWKLGGKHE